MEITVPSEFATSFKKVVTLSAGNTLVFNEKTEECRAQRGGINLFAHDPSTDTWKVSWKPCEGPLDYDAVADAIARRFNLRALRELSGESQRVYRLFK